MGDAATTILGSHEPKGLGTKLAPLLSGGFFRPLARPSAPLYVDCADRLEQASDDGGQLSHSDAIALIRDALVAHPSLKLDEDEGGQFGIFASGQVRSLTGCSKRVGWKTGLPALMSGG